MLLNTIVHLLKKTKGMKAGLINCTVTISISNFSIHLIIYLLIKGVCINSVLVKFIQNFKTDGPETVGQRKENLY